MPALLFDLDGTLLDAGGSGGPAMADACRATFGEAFAPDAYDIPFSGRTDTAIVAAYHAAHDAEPTDESRAAFRDAYLAALPGHLERLNGRALPGAVALLDALAGRAGVTTGLLTGNFRRGAEAKLRRFGLLGYFDTDRGGYGDDSPDRCDVAAAAVAALGPHDGPIWVLGDTPADVACGKSVGAKTLAVATGTYSRGELDGCGADVLLDTLSDTAAVLAALGVG